MSSPATVPQECVMYEFNLDQYFSQTSARERASLVAKLIKLRDDGQNRNACELYANKIGVRPLPIYNESYYQDQVNYNLALLLAHMGNPNEATQFMEQSKVFPADGGKLQFSDHNSRASFLFDQKERCKKKISAILIASLPKSASATIAGAFQQILDMPVIRLSIEGGVRGIGL